MNSLGKRIKNLRKKRKMTLETLAGQQMTKGMLSLIENDKAKPSMENLAYLAERLDIAINELLENISITEVREILKKAEENFKEKKYDQVLGQLVPIIDDNLPTALESAKLLELYSKASYFAKKADWLNFLNRADELYMSLHLYNQSALLNHFLVWTEMNKYQYKTALQLLIQKKDSLTKVNAELDIINQLEFLWNEAILLFSIDAYKQASEKLQQAIALSKENNVYYRIEELYRLAFFYAMMHQKEQDMKFYLNKLDLFAQFIDSEDSKINVIGLRIHYYNSYAREYDKALDLTKEVYRIAGEKLKYFYLMETGKALFGKGEYEKALEFLLQFEEVSHWNHPFDLTIMYEVYAYIARCYFFLGQKDKAYSNSKYAMDHVEKLPITPSKKFILDTMKLFDK